MFIPGININSAVLVLNSAVLILNSAVLTISSMKI